MAKKRRRRRSKISRRGRKFIIVSLSLAFLLLIVFVGWAYLLRGSISIKGAISDYFEAVNNEDVKAYIECSYPKKWQDNYTPGGKEVSLERIVEDAFSYQSGAKYSDIKIKKTEKLHRIFVERIRKSINEIYGLDLNISEVYRVKFTVMSSYTYNGDIVKKESGVIVKYIYKYHEKWYFLADSLVLVYMNLDEQ